MLLLLAVPYSAGCAVQPAPAGGDARAAMPVGAADAPPTTAAEWANALRALVHPPDARPVPVLIVPAPGTRPPADTLLASGRLLQSEGLFAGVCAREVRRWDCLPDETRPAFRVNRARRDRHGTVRVEWAFSWHVAASDTTMAGEIRRSMCLTEDYHIKRAGQTWPIVRGERILIC